VSDAANNEAVFNRMRGMVLASPEAKRRALDIVGRGLRDTARKNARAKGGRGFWARIAGSVDYSLEGSDSVVVGATHYAARHKQFGGVISAPGKGAGSFRARMLAIPLPNCPRGKRSPRDWAPGELFRIKGKKGPLLARTKGKGKNKALEIIFALRKSVEQRPDPWWPDAAQIDTAIRRGIRVVAKAMGA
jgi:hypothetical protein